MTLRWNKRLIVAYKNTFASPEGLRVLADLVKQCPQLTSADHLRGVLDANRLFVKEGQRSVLLYIHKMLGRDPNAEAPDHAVNDSIGE